MATLQSIIDRSVQIASRIAGGNIAFDETAAELLLPHVFQNVLLDWRRVPAKLAALKETHDLTFAGGEADLPARAFPEYIKSSNLYDEADQDVHISYVNSYFDFRRAAGSPFGIYTIKDGKVLYLAPGAEEFDDFDGGLKLVAITRPAYPATAVETFAWPNDLTDEIIIELARALRGELLAEIKN